MLWKKKGCRRFMGTWILRRRYCYNQPHFIQVFTMMQPHGRLLYFMLLHISNNLVSASLVGYLYSADLMSAICFPYLLLMVHRYIYSRYSPVFSMLYQLYHFLPFTTLYSSSSLYLSIATWVGISAPSSPSFLFLQFRARCPNPLQLLQSFSFLPSNSSLSLARAHFSLSRLLINELYCSWDIMITSQGGYGVNGLILLSATSVGVQDLHPTRHLLPYWLLP